MNDLSQVCKEAGTAFIVDETHSGLSTGKGYFYYKGDADYVVFGKKTQVSGYFSRPESKQFSYGSGGETHKLMAFSIIDEVIQRDDLLNR